MSRVYVCDFCGKTSHKENRTLGETWENYTTGWYGLDACEKCFTKLRDALLSSDEVAQVKRKNIARTYLEITGKDLPPPRKSIYKFMRIKL